MDSKSLDLRRRIGAVTPSSTDRAKQFAKQLQKIWGSHTLAQCQEAAAHVFGHADWHSLGKAVKAGGAASKFDEELDDATLHKRIQAQGALLALEMSGVDPAEKYDRPPPRSTPDMGGIDMHTMVRLEQAGKRYFRQISEMVLWELRPTSKEAPEVGEVLNSSLGVASQATMARLPQLIGRWWKRSLPYQPEVGAALESFEWNKDRPTSILRFGGYWGELCMHYAGTIDWSMCMGTAYLLASQYAEAVLQRLQSFHDEAGPDVEQWSSVKFDKDTLEFHQGLMYEFLMAYPRDDLFSAGPAALKANAKKALKILESETSKSGLWK